MTTTAAAAGPPTADSADPFVHPALFYSDTEEYLAGTVGFIREGLANNEPVAVSVPGPNLELIRAELGSDADAVRLMDMTVEGRNPGRIIPGVLRAFADTYPTGRVRIIGEPIWAGRSATEYPACVQHEALINAAFTGREVTILCPYDTERLDPLVLADAHATHPTLIDSSGERPSGAYDPDHIVASYNKPLPPPPAIADVIAFDATSLTDTRHRAVAYARRAGMAEDHMVDLELVVAETITNSVVHGGGSGTLALWTEGRQLRCQVRDAGHITNPLAGRLPPQPFQFGGRGLLLVNQLTDLVRIHTGVHGTTIQMDLRLA
ncbi:sensor histidine kinase [Nocardia iowensis]|uniref:Sensor histidine kinase n=1 Tax=Nocardia iowensis TaxID=204891 RepID=A0ABX8RTS7_NOCIO|nr:sensor histidine kinase [Nocardia iowensis]QXN93040.1 sensor histidine kinase [Nocardia iowensis]